MGQNHEQNIMIKKLIKRTLPNRVRFHLLMKNTQKALHKICLQ